MRPKECGAEVDVRERKVSEETSGFLCSPANAVRLKSRCAAVLSTPRGCGSAVLVVGQPIGLDGDGTVQKEGAAPLWHHGDELASSSTPPPSCARASPRLSGIGNYTHLQLLQVPACRGDVGVARCRVGDEESVSEGRSLASRGRSVASQLQQSVGSECLYTRRPRGRRAKVELEFDTQFSAWCASSSGSPLVSAKWSARPSQEPGQPAQ